MPIRVPRLRHVAGSELPLRSYEALQGERAVNDLRLKRVLYGISCRNYEAAAAAIPGAIGLSGSTVSRTCIQASAAKLREVQARDLSGEDVVAVVLDGKTFADATRVIALGITLSGEKRFLGFVETDTENEKVLTPFLRSLVERGLDVSQGVLVILDGGKGLRSAGRKAFRDRVLVHRCQWHKRENVVRYLATREQAVWRPRLQRAYNRPLYTEALGALKALRRELEDRNQSAASRLAEGLETLTLHRLGLYGVLGRSLKTTNCLESVNALVEERWAKVDHWQKSSQRHRWLATALLDIEPRRRKVMGSRHRPTLRAAVKRALKIETTTSKKKAAYAIRSRRAFQLRMGLTHLEIFTRQLLGETTELRKGFDAGSAPNGPEVDEDDPALEIEPVERSAFEISGLEIDGQAMVVILPFSRGGTRAQRSGDQECLGKNEECQPASVRTFHRTASSVPAYRSRPQAWAVGNRSMNQNPTGGPVHYNSFCDAVYGPSGILDAQRAACGSHSL